MGPLRNSAVVFLSFLLIGAAAAPAKAADPMFQKWLQGLWPQAQALGVSRRTFESGNARHRA